MYSQTPYPELLSLLSFIKKTCVAKKQSNIRCVLKLLSIVMRYSDFAWIGLGFANCFLLSSSALALSVGTPITGSLTQGNTTNLYDPNNGFVPTGQGYLNASNQQNSTTVNLSNTSVEFGYSNNFSTITADFTTTTLTIQDIVTANQLGIPEQQTFVSTGFTGATLTTQSDSFPSGNSISISGDTITFNASLVSGGTYTAVYQINSASVPFEFSPVSGLAIGITSFLGMRLVKKSKLAAK